MPPLLDKYSADPEKLANLLSIPQYFDLDLYTSGRQEGSLQALLGKLKYIVQVHHEPEVSSISLIRFNIVNRLLITLTVDICKLYSLFLLGFRNFS